MPVLIAGDTNDLGTNGHAWVADGFKETYTEYYEVCDSGPNGDIVGVISKNYHSFVHMNWGWYGMDNGWFANYNMFSPNENAEYQYHVQIITNIHPF